MAHLILWDGDCGFCRRTTVWIMREDKWHRFEAIPYQQAPSPPMTPELRAACAESVHVIKEDGTIVRNGRAVLFILENIRRAPLARLLALPPFIWLVEWGYRIVAKHRILFSRFFFRAE